MSVAMIFSGLNSWDWLSCFYLVCCIVRSAIESNGIFVGVFTDVVFG